MRYIPVTLRRMLRENHTTMSASAAAMSAAIDSAFTSDPISGFATASARMTPAHSPSTPTLIALRR